MKSVEALVNLFQERGFRITPQRRAIFQYLSDIDNHPTADQIYLHISSLMPEVSQSTVYNTVRELIALGELGEVNDIEESGKRFETNNSIHHHLFCESCKSLIDLELDVPEIKIPKHKTEGFKIKRKKVTFYGLCQNCQQK